MITTAKPPPAAPIYRVKMWGAYRDAENYKIKEHITIGEIYTEHATRWLREKVPFDTSLMEKTLAKTKRLAR